ncbi:MAG: peptidoglycan-binding protein, partial [Clostridia bacterium]|nr:peptidoglycan-binding protein [Clostridia bacterium]
MTIPENITVHLGLPSDRSAPNVTVSFIDYIKNVASSEIYPTWPESALRANIYAQISYALNRVYTEYYRSRGYDFDITSTTQFDQTFIYGRDIFSNVGEIVDEVFNDYIVRQGSVEPLFAAYCNGTTVMCNGLSQWGSVALAEEGLTPYEILQYYYGDDINIVFNAPTDRNLPSYPGRPLRRGDSSQDVLTIQRQLNRIGRNYPAIGRINDPDGIFGQDTENAVKNFQRIFNLTQDGVVGKATWYKIKSIWAAVKRLAEVQSEGVSQDDVRLIYPSQLALGDTGDGVRNLQYFLSVIAFFDPQVPDVTVDGVFGTQTENAVRAIQRQAGLTEDG